MIRNPNYAAELVEYLRGIIPSEVGRGELTEDEVNIILEESNHD